MTNIIIIDEDKEHFKQTEKMLRDHYTVVDYDSLHNPFVDILAMENVLILLFASYEKSYFLSLLADFNRNCSNTPILLAYDNDHSYQEFKDIYKKMSLRSILKPFNSKDLLATIHDSFDEVFDTEKKILEDESIKQFIN